VQQVAGAPRVGAKLIGLPGETGTLHTVQTLETDQESRASIMVSAHRANTNNICRMPWPEQRPTRC
jgi:hypothetical protein